MAMHVPCRPPACLIGSMNSRARRLPDWRTLPPPHPELSSCVVIPVRNEARRLPAALRALRAQRDAQGRPLAHGSYEVLVLANNCDDASADVVRRFAASNPSMALHVVEVRFPAAVAHVGHARSCLMNEACRRLERSAGSAGIIASTDGDTRVAGDWLAATRIEIERGADAVGGSIVNDDDVALPSGVRALTRRDARYQRLRARLEHELDADAADPWPRHHQHFGASLAITVAAYRRVGGMPAEPFLEDEALFRSLRRHDLKVRHSHRVGVVTSSRRRGRVAVGLSWQLRVWQAAHAAGHDPLVTDPAHWAREIALRQRLRSGWQKRCGRSARAGAEMSAAELRLLAAAAARSTLGPSRLQREWRRAANLRCVLVGIAATPLDRRGQARVNRSCR